jgi:hypothetical protein
MSLCSLDIFEERDGGERETRDQSQRDGGDREIRHQTSERCARVKMHFGGKMKKRNRTMFLQQASAEATCDTFCRGSLGLWGGGGVDVASSGAKGIPSFWPSALIITGFVCMYNESTTFGCCQMREQCVSFSASPTGLLLPTTRSAGELRYFVADDMCCTRVREPVNAGIGGSIFDSAIGLGAWLARNREVIDGCAVLELGAGCGKNSRFKSPAHTHTHTPKHTSRAFFSEMVQD